MLARLLPSIFALLCLSSANVSQANERWYQVEVIIAERLSVDLGTESHSQPALRSRPAKQLKVYPGFGSQALVTRPNEEMRLLKVAQRLTHSGNYKTLYHQAWAQPFRKNKTITWIDIKGGEQAYNRHQLEGAIGLSLGRFLHLHTNLTLNQFSETRSNQQLSEVLGHLPFQQAQVWLQYQMTQSRKMRSKELHYVDHPKLALLIRIDPYTPSATIPLPAPQE